MRLDPSDQGKPRTRRVSRNVPESRRGTNSGPTAPIAPHGRPGRSGKNPPPPIAPRDPPLGSGASRARPSRCRPGAGKPVRRPAHSGGPRHRRASATYTIGKPFADRRSPRRRKRPAASAPDPSRIVPEAGTRPKRGDFEGRTRRSGHLPGRSAGPTNGDFESRKHPRRPFESGEDAPGRADADIPKADGARSQRGPLLPLPQAAFENLAASLRSPARPVRRIGERRSRGLEASEASVRIRRRCVQNADFPIRSHAWGLGMHGGPEPDEPNMSELPSSWRPRRNCGSDFAHDAKKLENSRWPASAAPKFRLPTASVTRNRSAHSDCLPSYSA